MVRVVGIEPTTPAWKAGVLPLNYTRDLRYLGNHTCPKCQDDIPTGVYPKSDLESPETCLATGIA